MVCRSTRAGSVAVALAKVNTGLDDPQVQSVLHQLRHQGAATEAAGIAPISVWTVRDRLAAQLRLTAVSDRRRESLDRRVRGVVVDPMPPDLAWAASRLHIGAAAARWRLLTLLGEHAARTGQPVGDVVARFTAARAAAPGGRQPRASAVEREQWTGLPTDPATRHALTVLARDPLGERPQIPLRPLSGDDPFGLAAGGYDPATGELALELTDARSWRFRAVPAELAAAVLDTAVTPAGLAGRTAGLQRLLRDPAHHLSAGTPEPGRCPDCGQWTGSGAHHCPGDPDGPPRLAGAALTTLLRPLSWLVTPVRDEVLTAADEYGPVAVEVHGEIGDFPDLVAVEDPDGAGRDDTAAGLGFVAGRAVVLDPADVDAGIGLGTLSCSCGRVDCRHRQLAVRQLAEAYRVTGPDDPDLPGVAPLNTVFYRRRPVALPGVRPRPAANPPTQTFLRPPLYAPGEHPGELGHEFPHRAVDPTGLGPGDGLLVEPGARDSVGAGEVVAVTAVRDLPGHGGTHLEVAYRTRGGTEGFLRVDAPSGHPAPVLVLAEPGPQAPAPARQPRPVPATARIGGGPMFRADVVLAAVGDDLDRYPSLADGLGEDFDEDLYAQRQALKDRSARVLVAALGPGWDHTLLTDQTRDQVARAPAGDRDRLLVQAREQAAAALVNQWAISSNDEPLSRAFQRAAAEEFALSDIHRLPRNTWQEPWIIDHLARRGGLLRAVLRAQYEETQRRLAPLRLDFLRLHRGFRWPRGDPIPRWVAHEGASTDRIRLRPMSSFATSRDAARGFAQPNSRYSGSVGVVIDGLVPVDRIMSMPGCGFGAYTEHEVVVLGDTPVRWAVTEADTSRDYDRHGDEYDYANLDHRHVDE